MRDTLELWFPTAKPLQSACQTQEWTLTLWIRCMGTCLLWVECQLCLQTQVTCNVMKICMVLTLRLRCQAQTLSIVILRIPIMEEAWFHSLIEVTSILIAPILCKTLLTAECQADQVTAANTKFKITGWETDQSAPKATPTPTSSTTSTMAWENDQIIRFTDINI